MMQIYTYFHYRGTYYEKSIYNSTEHYILPPLLAHFLPSFYPIKHSRTPVDPLGHLMDQSMLCLLNAYGLPFFELTSSYCRTETDF